MELILVIRSHVIVISRNEEDVHPEDVAVKGQELKLVKNLSVWGMLLHQMRDTMRRVRGGR